MRINSGGSDVAEAKLKRPKEEGLDVGREGRRGGEEAREGGKEGRHGVVRGKGDGGRWESRKEPRRGRAARTGSHRGGQHRRRGGRAKRKNGLANERERGQRTRRKRDRVKPLNWRNRGNGSEPTNLWSPGGKLQRKVEEDGYKGGHGGDPKNVDTPDDGRAEGSQPAMKGPGRGDEEPGGNRRTGEV